MTSLENIKFKKSEFYTVGDYILRIFFILLFSMLCFTLFRTTQDPLNSIIASTTAFFLIVVFSAFILLKSNKWIAFFIIAYFVKILIGLIHYLYFIDPEYFQTGAYKALTWEFEAVFERILSYSHEKQSYGIFYFEYRKGDFEHQEILNLISIPFVYFGDNVLTITPINAFSSLLISINVILISKYKFHSSNKRLKYIAITTAYFPMTLISSLLYRDIVGLALMSIGLVLVLLSKKSTTKYLMLIIACYLFYLQRTVYPVILIVAFVIDYIFFQRTKRNAAELFYKIVTVIVCLIAFLIIFKYSNTETNQEMASGAFSFNFLFLPVKLILGLVGPFPWNQFLMYEIMPAYAYQLEDYLQATLNMSIVAVLIIYRKKYFNKKSFNLLNITGLLLILTGLFNTFMHMTYVGIGFVFLLPWLFSNIDIKKFTTIYIKVFLIIFILNILVIAFFGNLGVKSLL